ncbi:hypothetical protein B296_00034792 [Ensete ventricosum]|uniref:Uncharacterized protein n=1 Tax=Ensete ventricosum TaxID=4639 RepID=A0A426Z452_ENSVE|nr:hypothetical protein B296_00034792 [Ensete ventricosum]
MLEVAVPAEVIHNGDLPPLGRRRRRLKLRMRRKRRQCWRLRPSAGALRAGLAAVLPHSPLHLQLSPTLRTGENGVGQGGIFEMLIVAEREDEVEKRKVVRVYRFSSTVSAKSLMEFAEVGEIGRGTAALEGVAEALITHWDSCFVADRTPDLCLHDHEVIFVANANCSPLPTPTPARPFLSKIAQACGTTLFPSSNHFALSQSLLLSSQATSPSPPRWPQRCLRKPLDAIASPPRFTFTWFDAFKLSKKATQYRGALPLLIADLPLLLFLVAVAITIRQLISHGVGLRKHRPGCSLLFLNRASTPTMSRPLTRPLTSLPLLILALLMSVSPAPMVVSLPSRPTTLASPLWQYLLLVVFLHR